MARLVLSLNERLMLHLSEMDRYKDDPEVPAGASQEGIAQRLGAGVHTVSRMLAPLVKEDIVSERLAHVRGAPRRRKVYSLTEKGAKIAQSLRADILGRKVVLERDGKAQEMSFDEAARRIGSTSGITPGFAEMVDLALAGDVVRMEALKRPPTGKMCGPEFAERSQGRPMVGSFFGREAERESILEKIDDRDTSAILVWGLPGIGKSTLASKVYDELSGKRMLFWYSFREWDTESSFMTALSGFLLGAGRAEVSLKLERGGSHVEMFMPLVSDLSDCGLVMFLDDAQKCSRQLMSLLSLVVEAAGISKSSKVVILSRTIPGFFSGSARGSFALELGGLDRESAWHMAQSLNAENSVRIVDEGHGHPLLMSMMARGGPGRSQGDVISFLEREVYSAVSGQERKVLELLSVFRHPVPIDAIPDTDYEVISGLRQRALVVEQEDGVLAHDLVKDFFSSRLTADAKRSYHSVAAAYCDRNPDAEWKLETLYHLVEAGSWAEARKVAMSNAIELSVDFPEETLALVSKVPIGSLREDAELLFVRGQLREEVGDEESALEDLERSLSLLGADEDADRRAAVLEVQARLRSEVKRWSEALADHQKALRIYEGSNDKEGQLREWINIGGVLRRKGDPTKAREAYSKAMTLATRSEDRRAEAACLNNLGMLDRDEGRFRDAEAHLRESVKLAHVVKDASGEARGLENLAELLRVERRLPEAVALLLDSAEAFRRAGEIQEHKRVQSVCADALAEQGELARAIAMAETALVDPETRKRRGLFQKAPRFDQGDLALSETLVGLRRRSSDLKKAHKEMLRFKEMADSLGDPFTSARALLLQAIILEDEADLDSAERSLSEAEGILKSAGDSEGLIAVLMRRGVIEERRGNLAAAADQYREAERLAEMGDNGIAIAVARERLASLSNGDQGGSSGSR